MTAVIDKPRDLVGQFAPYAHMGADPGAWLVADDSRHTVRLTDDQNRALERLAAHGSVFARQGDYGNVVAVIANNADADADLAGVYEFTFDADGSLVNGRQFYDEWVPADDTYAWEDAATPSEFGIPQDFSVVLNAAQDAAIDHLNGPSGVTTAVRRGDRDKVIAVSMSLDGFSIVRSEINVDGKVMVAERLSENADGVIHWSTLTPAAARRIAKNGIAA